MSENALVLRDYARQLFQLTDEAKQLKEAALERAALVGTVKNHEQLEDCHAAREEVKRVMKLIEDSRTLVKKPLLDFGRVIDRTCKDFVVDLVDEDARLERSEADYAAIQLAAQRSAEAARNNAITELERQREEALSKCATVEERDQVTDEFCARIADLGEQVNTMDRVEGQRIEEDWEIVRINEFQLLRARPDLVRKIEFNMRGIKEELKLGVTLPGVEARKVVKSGVRLPPKQEAIEV